MWSFCLGEKLGPCWCLLIFVCFCLEHEGWLEGKSLQKSCWEWNDNRCFLSIFVWLGFWRVNKDRLLKVLMLLNCRKWLWKGDFPCPPFLMLSFLELCCLRERFCLKTHGNSPNLNSKNMAHRHRRTCNFNVQKKNSCSLSLFYWAPWPQSIRLFFSVNCWRGSIIGCFFNLKGMSVPCVAKFLLRWRCFSCVLPCFAFF